MAVTQTTHAGQRRLVFGFNVVLQAVIVAVLVVLAVWVAQHYKKQVDVTRSGVNSLSPRTTKLLKNLGDDVTITALYTVLSEYDEQAQKRQDAIRDLLRLYESTGGGHVTANLIDPMKDRLRLPAVLKGLREKPAYRDQAQKHREVLQEFPEIQRRAVAAITAQVEAAQRLLAADPALQNTVLMEVSQELQRLVQMTEASGADVQQLVAQEIPQYGAAVEKARGGLERVAEYLNLVRDWVAKNAATETGLTPDAQQFLRDASTAFEPLVTEINTLAGKAEGLERVELEDLVNQLNRWASAPPILVETAEKALVLPFEEVWPFKQAPVAAAGDEREFRGEQALSSAILKLTQKERTAVVFTRFGGPSPIVPDFSQMNMMNMRQLPRAPYGVLNDLLEKENFITQDWDLKTQKEPPQVEDAARTVYVVLPPTEPEQPDPRRPPTEPHISEQEIQTVLDAVDKAGMAIFLTRWEPPAMPFPGAPPGEYEYADYLESQWGVAVQCGYLVLPFAPSTENPSLYVPNQETQRGIVSTPDLVLTKHPLVEPLRGTPVGLDITCPLKIAAPASAPAGLTVTALIEVKATPDVWALQNVERLNEDFRTRRGTSRHEDDLAPPFPVAVAAEKAADHKRVVVFASATFVGNAMLEMPGSLVLTGAGLQALPAFLGNPDLFINALHWLTNDADRISVGAQPTDIPRLDGLKNDKMLVFWRVFLVGLWPGLALVIGAGVWMLRRR